MQTLLVDGVKFEQVPASAHYETQYTKIIEQQAKSLFPGFSVCQFEDTIESSVGANKPDLAIIDDQLRRWWVVEVELAHHPLYGHVIPQVETFVYGHYTTKHAQYLAERLPYAPPEQLERLITTVDPIVLVIAIGEVSDWKTPLKRIGVDLAHFSMYRSDLDKTVFGLDGDVPRLSEHFVTNLRPDKTFPGWLEIMSPENIRRLTVEEELDIQVSGESTKWIVRTFAACTLLEPTEGSLIQRGRTYSLTLTTDDQLTLERDN